MNWRLLLIVGCLLSRSLSAQAPVLPDDEVNQAIVAAEKPSFESLFVEARGPFAADFSVLLQGPVGRVMDVAPEAYVSYKPLTAASLPVEMKVRTITVSLVMHSDGRRLHIKNVVVMPSNSASRGDAIQPGPNNRRSNTMAVGLPRTWKPGYGWQPAGLPLAYQFSERDLPDGDLQLIVATDAGERRYTVRAVDRPRMR